MSLAFVRATRAQVPLKLGISGPSGSGKTTAALKLVRGLVGKDAPIAFLDTENGSASLYADLTTFDVLNMNPPYQVAKFTQAIEDATQAGYKALIIDSASAEWQELLVEKEALDARGGNSFANWGSITKKHEDFLKAVRNSSIHLILCLRAKQEHVQDKDSAGRTTVRKVGMAAIQREGMEYELTTVFELAMDHNAKASKDRTGMFEGRLEQVNEATGRELAAWLSSGKPLLAEPAAEAFAPPPTPKTPPPPAPKPKPAKTAREVIAETAVEVQQDKPAVDPVAENFVDAVCDRTELIDAQLAMFSLCREHQVSIDALGAYLKDKGQMTGGDWTTLDLERTQKLVAILRDPTRRHSFVTTALTKYTPAA